MREKGRESVCVCLMEIGHQSGLINQRVNKGECQKRELSTRRWDEGGLKGLYGFIKGHEKKIMRETEGVTLSLICMQTITLLVASSFTPVVLNVTAFFQRIICRL